MSLVIAVGFDMDGRIIAELRLDPTFQNGGPSVRVGEEGCRGQGRMECHLAMRPVVVYMHMVKIGVRAKAFQTERPEPLQQFVRRTLPEGLARGPPQDLPRRLEDEQRDNERENSIGPRKSPADGDAHKQDKGGKRVAPMVLAIRLDRAESSPPGAPEGELRHGLLDGHSDRHRDQGHASVAGHFRMEQLADTLGQELQSKHAEHRADDKRRDELGAPVPERMRLVGRTLGDPHPDQQDQRGQRVRKRMPRVRQDGGGSGEIGDDELVGGKQDVARNRDAGLCLRQTGWTGHASSVTRTRVDGNHPFFAPLAL